MVRVWFCQFRQLLSPRRLTELFHDRLPLSFVEAEFPECILLSYTSPFSFFIGSPETTLCSQKFNADTPRVSRRDDHRRMGGKNNYMACPLLFERNGEFSSRYKFHFSFLWVPELSFGFWKRRFVVFSFLSFLFTCVHTRFSSLSLFVIVLVCCSLSLRYVVLLLNTPYDISSYKCVFSLYLIICNFPLHLALGQVRFGYCAKVLGTQRDRDSCPPQWCRQTSFF